MHTEVLQACREGESRADSTLSAPDHRPVHSVASLRASLSAFLEPLPALTVLSVASRPPPEGESLACAQGAVRTPVRAAQGRGWAALCRRAGSTALGSPNSRALYTDVSTSTVGSGPGNTQAVGAGPNDSEGAGARKVPCGESQMQHLRIISETEVSETWSQSAVFGEVLAISGDFGRFLTLSSGHRTILMAKNDKFCQIW